MQVIASAAFALAQADAMCREWFGRDHGDTSWSDTCDRLDRLTTAHLSAGPKAHVLATTAPKRRAIRFTMEAGHVLALVPVRDPCTGQEVWAVLLFSTLLNLIAHGADAAWFLAYGGRDRSKGQVRCKVPLSERVGTTNATIARLIVGARKGQQARSRDGDPLNLRTENIALTDLAVGEGQTPAAKTNTRAHQRGRAEARAALARRKAERGE